MNNELIFKDNINPDINNNEDNKDEENPNLNDFNIKLNEDFINKFNEDKNINNELVMKYSNIKKNLDESKKKLFKLKKINFKNINLLIKKNNLIEHIQLKCNKLGQKLRLIELKNDKYKKCYNCFNIAIILISTSLTIIESAKAVIIDDCDNSLTSKYFQLSPIFLGSLITCSASILKFKKYQEKMENIIKLIEKGNNIIGIMKKIREELIFCNNNDYYEKIEERYKLETYENYIFILQDIERLLKDHDYDKYLELIHNTDYKIHVLEQNKKLFFKNYLPEEELNLNLKKNYNKKSFCLC